VIVGGGGEGASNGDYNPGERIRDKFAASRRKGMWRGGTIPLGYEVKDHKLIVNEAEAETVRLTFRRYLALGCARSTLPRMCLAPSECPFTKIAGS
jgi:DNA invertase Pin-like site-specific DNA recombinase